MVTVTLAQTAIIHRSEAQPEHRDISSLTFLAIFMIFTISARG
jgi:hypothetical protein